MSLHVGAHIGGAVEVAVRLMCAPAVVVEDVGGAGVCGCHQKSQMNQLSELPSRSAMVRATLDYGTLPQVSKEFCGWDDVNTIHPAAVFVE